MANFLLIHGSGHGAWCWRDVLVHLGHDGHTARAIDLPGNGDDATPLADVTLSGYAQAISKALGGFDGPVNLVGHSLGGISITEAAGIAAERIARLVYITAWVPVDGQSARDMRTAAGCRALMDATRFSADGLCTTFADHLIEDLFYHDCLPEDVAFARNNLCAQPIAPSTASIHLTDSTRALARSYILCTGDRAIPPGVQRAMTEGWPPGSVHAMKTGHSPFFAAPETLAGLLSDIAADPT